MKAKRVDPLATPPTKLHERIRYERQVAGMPMEDLAEAIGVSRSVMSQIELGTHGVSGKRIGAIAFMLGINVGRLLNNEIPGDRWRSDLLFSSSAAA